MKLWKRIAALCISVSTMGISMLSAGCEDIVGGFLNSSQGNSVGSSIEDSSSEIHTHEWTEVVVKEATCTEDGKKVLKCECGEEKEEVIPAGHSLIREQEAIATCMQEGLVRIYCENCEYETQEIEEKQGHVFMFNNECFWCGKTKQEVEGGAYFGDVEVVAYDGSDVTITFYHTMGAVLRDVLNQHIAEFNKIYPNITVEHQSLGSYDDVHDEIKRQLTAGRAPNLAYCYNDHVAAYHKATAVAALDDFIAYTGMAAGADGSTEIMGFTQEQIDGFVPSYYAEGRTYADDKMYTLPFVKSTEVLYYNKTFFEENNLTVPATWDEMEAVMQRIKELDPHSIPLGYDSEANWFITMTQQLGTPYTSAVEGEKFLFDVEENRQFVGKFREWYQNGWVITEQTLGSYTSDLFIQTDPDQWKTYMTISSSAGASYHCPDPYRDENGQVVYPFEVGVAMIPQIDLANPKVVLQGPSLCMFKKSNPQEMAATWLFMKFLTTNLELQAEFSLTSGCSSTIKDIDEKLPMYDVLWEKADGNANLSLTVLKQCLAQQDAMFATPAFVGSDAARDEVGYLMLNCFVDNPAEGQTVADFIKNKFSRSIEKLRYNYGA